MTLNNDNENANVKVGPLIRILKNVLNKNSKIDRKRFIKLLFLVTFSIKKKSILLPSGKIELKNTLETQYTFLRDDYTPIFLGLS